MSVDDYFTLIEAQVFDYGEVSALSDLMISQRQLNLNVL